jgi:hypothetical protein
MSQQFHDKQAGFGVRQLAAALIQNRLPKAQARMRTPISSQFNPVFSIR